MAPAVGRSFIVAVLLTAYCCGLAFGQVQPRADVNQQCDIRRDAMLAEDPMGNGATFLRCKPTTVGHIGFWERKVCPNGLSFDFVNQQCSGPALQNVGNDVNNVAATTSQPHVALIDSSCAAGQQCIGGTVCDLRTMKCLCPVGTVPHMETLSCVSSNGAPSSSSTTSSFVRMQNVRSTVTYPTLNPFLPQAIPITPTTTYGIPYSTGPTPAPMNTNHQQQSHSFFNISPQPFATPTPVPRPAPYMNPNQPAPMPTRQPYIFPQAQTTFFSLPTSNSPMNNFATVAPGSSCRNGQKCIGGSICNHMVGVCMCPSNTEDQGVRVGDRCDRFSECADDSTCFQGRCQCVSPLTLHNGRCVPQQAIGARVGPGEPCDMGQICIKGSICNADPPVCLCPEGTDLREDSCVPSDENSQGGVQTVFVTSGGHQLGGTNQAGVGAKCALNTECMIGAYCNGNTNPPSCQCLSTHVNIEGKCHKVIYPGQKGCEYDKQCTASFEGTSCVDRLCVCPDGSKAIEQTCVAEFALPGYACNESSGLPMCSGGSFCLGSKCACPSGLHEFQHQCIFGQALHIKPGSPCGPLEHCPPNLICKNSVCACPIGSEETEIGCKKKTRNAPEDNHIVMSQIFADETTDNTPPGFFCLPEQEFCAGGRGLCMNGFCHCAPGYLRIDDHCQSQVAKRGDNCSLNLGQVCETGSECIDGRCLCRGVDCRHLQEVVVSIAGQSCRDGQMCTGASTCVEGMCQCAPGFHLRSGGCELLQGVFAPIGSRCTQMDRCSGGAICLKDTCTCTDGSEHRYGRCEQAPGGRCIQGQICTGDSLCELGTCRCQEGKTLFKQTCRRNIAAPGQSCQSGQVCSGGSACRFGMCICPAGHTAIAESCVRDAASEEKTSGAYEAAPGQSCKDGETCTGQSVCYQGFCICPLDTEPLDDRCVFKQAVLPDSGTTPAATDWWSAATGPSAASTEVDPVAVSAGAKCDESMICTRPTQCIRQLCRCHQGETLKNGECHEVSVRGAPPGQYCKPNHGIECIGESYCANGTCVCPHGLVIAGGECAPISFGYAFPDDSCQNGEVCLGGSSCSLGVCRCLRNFHIVGKDCEPMNNAANNNQGTNQVVHGVTNKIGPQINGSPPRPGEPCQDSCTDGALCIAFICKCPIGTLEVDFKCVSLSESANQFTVSKPSGSGMPGDNCDLFDRCSGGAFCLDKKCVCPEGYAPFSGKCALTLKKPGELCMTSEQCDGGSICDFGKCKCRGGKVIRNGECADRIQVGVGEDCMHDQQCAKGSVCNIITGLCECSEREVTVGNTCQPEFAAAGASCAIEQKCLGGSVCRNGICTCPDGYQLMIGYCVPPKSTEPSATDSVNQFSSRSFLKPLPQDLHMSLFNQQFQSPEKHLREKSKYASSYSNNHQLVTPGFLPPSQHFLSTLAKTLLPNQQHQSGVARQQPALTAAPTLYSSYQPVQPGYPCVHQDICSGGAICFQGICTCPSGTTFDHGYCTSARNILRPGEHCGNGGTCGGNSVCSFNWCRCLNGTVNDNGHCTPINQQSGIWNSFFPSPINQNPALSRQRNRVSTQAGPNENCAGGQICTGRSICMPNFQGMTCQCPPFTAVFMDQCLPLQRQVITATVGQSCAGGESCSGGSFCQGGVCRCPIGTEVYYGHCLKLVAPGQSCGQGQQCGGGSFCDTNFMVCLCPPDSREMQGRCQRINSAQVSRRQHSFVGLPCNMSMACIDNSYCSATGYCVCEPEHVQIQRRCIPKEVMVELGYPCNLFSICAGGSYCINGLCSCINGTSANNGECRVGKPQSNPLGSCANGEECTRFTICINSICQCPEGTTLLDNQCSKLSQLGQPCNSGEHCQDGSICDGIVCQCPPDMSAENGECLPTGLLSNPGATCFHGEICAGGSFCNASACLCAQDQNPVLDKCETPIANVRAGGACSFTFHCQMGLTCMFGICKCLPHEDDCPGGGRLTSPPGGSCSAEQECTGSSVCRDGWCVCPETNMIVTRGICVPSTATRPVVNPSVSSGGVHSFQSMPTSSGTGTPNPYAGRKATPGTSCGPIDVCIGGASCIDGMCICPHGTVVAGKRCVNTDKMTKSSKETSAGKPLDACSTVGLICSGGTVCVGKSCQCPEGTFLSGDRCSSSHESHESSESDYARPYESCEKGETCIGGSVCGKEQTCTCPSEKPILRDHECIASNEKPIIRGQENKAAPGEPCDVGTICTGSSMCVQGTCHCQTGYLAIQGQCTSLPTTTEGVTREGNYALPLMECGPSTQCLGGSICDAISSVCKCPPGSVPVNGICQAASTFATQAPLSIRTTMGRYAGVQIQPPRVSHTECVDDTQCNNDKVCIMKQCKCKPGFIEENGVCNLFEESKMPPGIQLGQACVPGDVCASNGMCIDGTCWCTPGTSLGEHGYCQPSQDLPQPRPTSKPSNSNSSHVKFTTTTVSGRRPSPSVDIDNSLAMSTTIRQSPAGSSGTTHHLERAPVSSTVKQQQAPAGVLPATNQHQVTSPGTAGAPALQPTFPAFVLPPATERRTTPQPLVLVRPNSGELPLHLGQQCTPNDICVQNAICYEGMCHCGHGFGTYEGRCLREANPVEAQARSIRKPGEPCSPDDECNGGSFCDGNVCTCPPQSHLLGGKCLQDILRHGVAAPSDSCANGEMCSGGSICDNDSKRCICAAKHFNDNGICRSDSAPKSVLPEQPCEHGEVCAGGSSCQHGVCKCAPDHFESDGYCRPIDGPSSGLNATGLRFSSKSGEPRPKATACPLPEDPSACRLPDCFCSRNGRAIPGGLSPDQTPQFVVLTFDDAVNGKTVPDYKALFEDQRIKNPNGCPVKGTFFISHEWTNYDDVQWLFHQGHELASNSITHTPLNGKSAAEWYGEMDGQRRILAKFANANENEIIGMRAPQLSIGGDEQLEMMIRAGFVYDNSISANPGHNGQPYWPQTMDYRLAWDCQTSECPTNAFPGVWEIPLNQFYGYYLPQIQSYKRSSMIRAATTLNATVEELVSLLRNNFDRAYKSNHAPYVLSLNADFLQLNGEGVGMKALEQFIADVSVNQDVWFVTLKELVDWLREPVPITQMDRIDSLKCRQGKKLHPSGRVPCSKPNRCMYRTPDMGSPEHQFHTCNPCPQMFPWVRNPVGKLYL